MNNKSISPNPQQPVDRVPAGQLPSALAELSEAELSARGVLPLSVFWGSVGSFVGVRVLMMGTTSSLAHHNTGAFRPSKGRLRLPGSLVGLDKLTGNR